MGSSAENPGWLGSAPGTPPSPSLPNWQPGLMPAGRITPGWRRWFPPWCATCTTGSARHRTGMETASRNGPTPSRPACRMYPCMTAGIPPPRRSPLKHSNPPGWVRCSSASAAAWLYWHGASNTRRKRNGWNPGLPPCRRILKPPGMSGRAPTATAMPRLTPTPAGRPWWQSPNPAPSRLSAPSATRSGSRCA